MRDDRGAVVPIVVITLVALFGMVALAVDLGGLAAKRRGLVNASDSGALAAAISFAVREQGSQCGTNEAVAQAKADAFASENVAGVTRLPSAEGWQTDCSAQTVRVGYQDEQRFFFAQVLGLSSTANVRGVAKAMWGPAGAANPVPIVLNVGTFQGDCDIPLDDAEIGQECYLWYDNDRFQGSVFGFMNLDQWDVAPNAQCRNAGAAERNRWIQDGFGAQLGLNYIDSPTNLPTYVCQDSGLADANWMTLEGEIGEIKYFPINHDPTQMMAPGGQQIDKYNIIGFAALRVDDVLTVQEAGGDTGFCNVNMDFTTGMAVNLGVLAQQQCGAPEPADVIRNLQVTRGSGCCTEGVHYTFDPDSTVLTWIAGNRSNVQVRFNWDVSGRCGAPPGNASARCLIVSWQGYQLGGSSPCPTCEDHGLEAVALIE